MSRWWSFFDRAFCITVPGNEGRVSATLRGFGTIGLDHVRVVEFPRAAESVLGSNRNRGPDDVGLLDLLTFSEKTKGPLAKELARNHSEVIRMAYTEGAQHVLVFEDDARFDPARVRTYLPRIVTYLRTNPYACFNFGALSTLPFRGPVIPGVAVAWRPWLGHAYALSRKGMARYLSHCYERAGRIGHPDATLVDALPTGYLVACPALCFQSEPPALFTQAMKRLPRLLSAPLSSVPFETFTKRYVCAFQVLLIGCVTAALVRAGA
jgi:hypothetical protein